MSALSHVAEVILGRPTVIESGAVEVEFAVDGVVVTLMPVGARHVRLRCEIGRKIPDEEAAVRQLLAAHFPVCDQSDGVLYSDESGSLLFSTDICDDGEGMAEKISGFCNSAIYLTAISGGRVDEGRGRKGYADVIFP